MPRRRKSQRTVMISVVAERYAIHPQTLRFYEREGLLKPSRSEGNTRLYDEQALKRLEAILTLTRDMGVNLAGVEVILNLREQLERTRGEMERLLKVIQQERLDNKAGVNRRHALVRIKSGPLAKVEPEE